MAGGTSIHEILSVFKECFDDDISLQQLQELKSDFVVSIYLKFLHSTLGASLDNMKMIGINSNENMLQYPEAYETAIMFPRVAKVLSWFFMSYYRRADFTYGDLVDPTPKRTLQFFTLLVDYMYTYAECTQKMNGFKQEVEEKKAQHAQSLEEKKNLKKKQAEILIQQDEEKKENDILTDEVNAIQQENIKLKKEIELSKHCNDDLKRFIGDLKLQKNENDEHVQQLKSKVVDNDEITTVRETEIKLEEMRQDIGAKKHQVASLEGVSSEVKRKNGILTDSIMPLLHDINNHSQQMATLEQDTKHLILEHRKEVSASEQLDHDICLLKQKEALLEQKRVNVKEQFSKKREGIVSDIAAKQEMEDTMKSSDQSRRHHEKALSDEIQLTKTRISDTMQQLVDIENYFDYAAKKMNIAVEQRNQLKEKGFNTLLNKMTEWDNKTRHLGI